MAGIHHFVSSLSPNDAIGPHVFELRRILSERYDSVIFYERADPPVATEGRPYLEYGSLRSAGSGDLLLYHMSIGSKMIDFLLDRPEKLALFFYDITPASFFEPYDSAFAEYLEEGRLQLKKFADRVDIAWAASEFSRKQLEEAGFSKTRILPILVDFKRYDIEPDRATLECIKATKGTGPDILFVGRIAPNKAQEELVKLLHVYREYFSDEPRLFIVGPHHHTTFAYSGAVSLLAQELGVRLEYVGLTSLREMVAFYRGCDVFVSLSRHEGFGVPMLEAMHLGLPVVAYGGGAVAETVGTGGIVFDEPALLPFAQAVHRITHDDDARRVMIEAGRRRAAEMSVEVTGPRIFEHLSELPL